MALVMNHPPKFKIMFDFVRVNSIFVEQVGRFRSAEPNGNCLDFLSERIVK